MERYIKFIQRSPVQIDVYSTDNSDDLKNKILRACGDLMPHIKVNAISDVERILEDNREIWVYKLSITDNHEATT
jgi:hypothetical protein